jgi:hypothetical protein
MNADLPRDYILSNKLYDLLKSITLIVLPALGTLYFALAQIWGLGSGEEVLATTSALAVFLGTVIKLGDRSYNNSEQQYDGEVNVLTNSKGGLKYDLALKGDPEGIQDLSQIKLKINP